MASSRLGVCSLVELMFYVVSLSTCCLERELEGDVFVGPHRGIPVGASKASDSEVL